MDLTDAHLRYLLAIHQLTREKGRVSSQDIAKFLDVKKASVSRMMQLLTEKGLLDRERYGKVRLSAQGLILTEGLAGQMDTLANFIRERLDLPAAQADCAARAAVATLPLYRKIDLCQEGAV